MYKPSCISQFAFFWHMPPPGWLAASNKAMRACKSQAQVQSSVCIQTLVIIVPAAPQMRRSPARASIPIQDNQTFVDRQSILRLGETEREVLRPSGASGSFSRSPEGCCFDDLNGCRFAFNPCRTWACMITVNSRMNGWGPGRWDLHAERPGDWRSHAKHRRHMKQARGPPEQVDHNRPQRATQTTPQWRKGRNTCISHHKGYEMHVSLLC